MSIGNKEKGTMIMNTIKDLRTATGMTQKAFADYFGMSKRAIESWEGGQRKCPEYLVDLIRYKLENENLIKKEGQA